MSAEKATKRNPMMMIGITLGALVGAVVLGLILASMTGVALLANLLSLAAYAVFAVIMIGMVTELKKISGAEITPWWVAVPILNLYFLLVKVPEAMAKAKVAAGATNPTKAGWMYLLVGPYALAADLNDLA